MIESDLSLMSSRTFSLIIIVGMALIGPPLPAEEAIRFNRDVRPILSEKCFQCHGPDVHERKAQLRLDRADGSDGAYRERNGLRAVVAGSLDKSALWYRINATDPDEVMPPPGAHVHGALTDDEKNLLRRWIVQGAEFEDFWSFVPPTSRPLPEVSSSASRVIRPIDRFVLARLEKENRTLQPHGSRRTLIRRVTFDLTGLPPTREDIADFVNDPSDDAYERMVDRLLASPQYGEHMARYWLDVVRFADTNGLHHDHFRQMTPYRDWVVRAFNDNLGFDTFAKYQIAGDLYPDPSLDQLTASGFNRLHLIIDVGTALPEESFTRNVVDRVTAVGTAFLGLTVQCAVCHDHKYDPMTQKDFYQLFAFFNNFDGKPETEFSWGSSEFLRGLQPPYIQFPTAEQTVQLERARGEVAQLEKLVADSKPAETKEGSDEESEELKALKASLKESQKALMDVEGSIPATLVMKEREEVRQAHILVRGVYDQYGDPVERDTPAFLPPMKEKTGLRTRMDFAEWLVADSNPLTVRVTVNRIWQQFFGVGIVKTSEDFGAQGEWPSHPDLLDYLALEFTRSGWNVKSLVRSIVLSETYRQSSSAPPERFVSDPDNRLLARGPRFRLDAEMIRDQVLSVAGVLNDAMYGKSVKPPQPQGLWIAVAMPSSYPKEFQSDSGDQIYRRSLYTFWKRAVPPPQMTIFDAPMRESCVARRERTNTPLQALMLMNEGQFFLAAMYCAADLLRIPSLDADERIRLAHERVTSQLPSSRDLGVLRTALRDFRSVYSEDLEQAKTMVESFRGGADFADRPVELASWTMLVHALLNLDVTKTRQ